MASSQPDEQQECVQLFRQKFGRDPRWLIRCPGRVNIIGEHIDYSDYSVLPMAIVDSTWVAVGECIERKIFLENVDSKYPPFSLEIGDSFSSVFPKGLSPKWQHYFLAGWRGILETLAADTGGGEIAALAQARGMCAVVGSQIPPSAGLSSSSALVCAAALTTICVQTGNGFGERISRKDLAEIATKSERFVGMEGGGMDQACECLAQQGSALRIDFSPSLCWTHIQLPQNALFAVLHSGQECNKGTTSYYNQRVVECRIAAQLIAKKAGCLNGTQEWHTVRTLRNVAKLLELGDRPGEMLALVEKHLTKEKDAYSRAEICTILECSDTELAAHSLNSNTQDMQQFWLAKRAKHVYSEATRVLEFERVCRNMQGRQALEEMAALMNDSHKSCAELFECSCPELDATVAECLKAGCLGARLTGAGWGGCAVALVDAADKKAVEASGLKVLFWSEPSAGIEALLFNST